MIWNLIRAGGRVYLLSVIAIILAPLFASLVFSFNADRFPSLPLKGFTTEWYVLTFTDPDVIDAIKRSFMVAIPVGIVSTLLGFAAAYSDYRYSFRGKSLFNLMMLLPPTIPAVIMGLAMLSYLSRINLAGNVYSIFISHVVTGLPSAAAPMPHCQGRLLRVESDRSLSLRVDGDLLAASLRVQIELLPRALDLAGSHVAILDPHRFVDTTW